MKRASGKAMFDAKKLSWLALGSACIALGSGAVIAQTANPEANSTGLRPALSGSAASDPAKATKATSPAATSGGIDPELGPIAEPEEGDVAPAYRQNGTGTWMTPEDEMRARIRREALSQAEAEQQALAASGLVMPRLVGPNIPLVPLELLFPPEALETGPKTVREIRGTGVMIGALDREKGTNVRVRVPVGSQVTYGSLRLKLSACYASNPEDPMEAWAYVEVSDMGRQNTNQLAVLPQRNRRDMREANKERVLRKGWIIASSPAVTPIDHPTYDMWLVSCEGAVAPPSATQSSLNKARPRSEGKAGAAGPDTAATVPVAPEADPGESEPRTGPVPAAPAPAAPAQGKSKGT
ncbi:DUF2155 domain-containing protein [Aquidulcibacter sp.]|uniref:DUF2155 domain-containing protein n=1 Tax=Aquidulcibacter sp. TaxID=2052990 RepID=UPI003BA73915